MKKDTIKFYSIIENLVPEYVKEEFPLSVEFLRQYYKSQENQSAALDIIHNIDKYVQVQNVTNLKYDTFLTNSVEYGKEIFIHSDKDLPKTNGLVKIDDEIILYDRIESIIYPDSTFIIPVGSNTIIPGSLSLPELPKNQVKSQINDIIGKILIVKDSNNNIIATSKILNVEDGLSVTLDSIPILDTTTEGYDITGNDTYTCDINGTKLVNCTRGFSATTSYQSDTTLDELIYEETKIQPHKSGSKVINLSVLFLKEFLTKIKTQIAPGFENEKLYSDINEEIFISNIKQFYSAKGTDCSFEILFRVLYGEDVQIIRPRDYLFEPSNAQYTVFKNLVVESLEGNPESIENLTLFQDEYGNVPEARGTIAKVEKILRGDKTYYVISLDQAKENRYDTNIGSFSIHPKTSTTSVTKSGSSFIDVDSTLSFPESGVLEITKKTKIVQIGAGNPSSQESIQKFIVSYTSKTSTQFLGCSDIAIDIDSDSEVRLNTFAYAKKGTEIIKVNITGVLSSVNIRNSPYYSSTNETVQIETLGSNSDQIQANNWIFNIPVEYDVKSVELLDQSDFTYKIELYDDNILSIGDSVDLSYVKGSITNGVIVGLNDKKTFLIKGFDSRLELENKYRIKKNLSKVQYIGNSSLSQYSSNVQNVYIDPEERVFVNSQSFPSYQINLRNRNKSFSGSYIEETNILILNHGFYTGDSVIYEPNPSSSLDLKKGIYFVNVINNDTIQLARSLNNISTNNFVSFSGVADNDTLSLSQFYNSDLSPKFLTPQNILRQVSKEIKSNTQEELKTKTTSPGTTGIFVNGVELLNYKSKDFIFYGGIKDIFVSAPGQNYDIINAPKLDIQDEVGSGATGYVAIKGSLQRIDIIDPGFDFIETPKIIITGGNGKNARATANLTSVDHDVSFNANSGIGTTTNIIGFSTYHKFRNGEIVIYEPRGRKVVSGLSTNSQYYVSVIDPRNIKLFKNFNDFSAGINTVSLVGLGTGRQYFKSLARKNIVSSIQVVDTGSGYETKLRSTTSSGISTYSDSVYIRNHGYLDGEIIRYDATESPVSGLTSGTSYYVTKLDDNNFKLSNVSVGNSQKNIFYSAKKYVRFNTSGSGVHKFNYEPIKVEVIGSTGIGSTFANQIQIQPIFVGNVTSVHLESEGENYGSEILNLKKLPNINLLVGRDASVTPVVDFSGAIVDVIVIDSGAEYYSIPSIRIKGTGSGAILTPIIKNRSLSEIKIISGGAGYNENTIIEIIPSGFGAKFEPKINYWNIDLVERLSRNNQLSEDDGVLYGGSEKDGLEFTHLYASRKLRQSVLGVRNLRGGIVYNPDLEVINGSESISLSHSPIIGWAYDGNPIYGPYGYSSPTGGAVRLIRSGYKLQNISKNRPNYPLGSFVEDYKFVDEGDLDEHNGRFCVTPEFPNGIYAYFCTIDPELNQPSGSFANYKKPIFPYAIGNSYYSNPIKFNFDRKSTFTQKNIETVSLLRNTKPYGLLNKNTYYPQIIDPNQIKKQNVRITALTSGKVESVGIYSGGSDYSVGSLILFDDNQARATISQIKGKLVNKISVATSSINNVEFIRQEGKEYIGNGYGNNYLGVSSVPHNLLQDDLVTITSSFDYNISGQVSVNSHKLTLRSGIDSSSNTGIVTYLNVIGSLDPNLIRENDIYFLADEQIKILNVDPEFSRVRILRNQSGTVGLSSIRVGVAITENPRKFNISFTGLLTSYNFKTNKELYFDPVVSVGIGTTSGVGITSTLFLGVNNFRHPVSIGTGSTTFLYFSDIRDLKNYTSGGYVQVAESSNSSFNTEKVKIISIGTTSIKIDRNTSSLSGLGVTAALNKWDTEVIPTRAIYLPNHDFETGDVLTYKSNGGTSIGISTNGINLTTLTNDIDVYVAKLSEDLIGISTVKVGLGTTGVFSGITSESRTTGLLYFTSIGTGNTHSFVTNYDDILLGDVSKNIVTVETKDRHGLVRNDEIEVKVISGITTTIRIEYNKKHRRLVADSVNFSASDVDIISNTITVPNHKLKTGQKIIHTSSSPVGGLNDNEIYVVIVITDNKIKLTEEIYDSKLPNPKYIDLTSTSFGTISKINPPIEVIKDSRITFDLSDSSLSFIASGLTSTSAFKLEFYKDSAFKEKYETSEDNALFDVIRSGSVGIGSAYTTISTKNIPNTLYYNLIPINLATNSEDNLGILVDNDIQNGNKIIVNNSAYDGKYTVVGVTSTTFYYNLPKLPESSSYTDSDCQLDYFVDSSSARGAITKINVDYTSKNLTSLPRVVGIDNATTGKNAILYVDGFKIGTISQQNIELLDSGFGYLSDSTLRPTGKFSTLIEIESYSSLNEIKLISKGKNYSLSPDLILYDTYRNEILDDAILKYNITDHSVNIIKNTNKLSDYIPKVIPINNTNGVGISTVSFNASNQSATVTLNQAYSSLNDFPFSVGDKVFVENISVGLASTLRGYNSSDYGYASFTVISRDPNIGGIGATVTYSLNEFLTPGEILGTFDASNSFGRIINENDIPKFETTSRKKTFFKNEIVKSESSSGVVEYHNPDRNILKVSTSEKFNKNDNIIGLSSKTIGKVIDVREFKVDFIVDSSSTINRDWKKETGFLNYNTQRLHDSDYYQYFSYAVRSKVEIDKWDESVDRLNHTVGFKKFSDLIISCNSDDKGMPREQEGSDISGIADITNMGDLNCHYDFDLVKEDNIRINSNLGSKQVFFNSRVVQDYYESIGNRVLTLDDVSNTFDSNPRTDEFSIVEETEISSFTSKKYFFEISQQNNANVVETGIITLIKDDTTAYLNQYAFTNTDSPIGVFDFTIAETLGQLLFYPYESTRTEYDINLLSITIPNVVSGLGSVSLGNVVNLASNTYTVSTASTSTIAIIPSTYRASKVLVQIGSTTSSYGEFTELTLLNDGSSVDILQYGDLQIARPGSTSSSISGVGTFTATISGGNILLKLNPEVGIGNSAVISTFATNIGNSSLSDVGVTTYTSGYIKSISNSISASATPSANVISTLDSSISASYYIVSVEDTTNNRYQTSEIILVSSGTTSYINEFGLMDTNGILGTFTRDISSSNTRLLFTPLANIDVEVRTYELSLSNANPVSDSRLSLNNDSYLQFNGNLGKYSGTQLDIKKSFNLTHNGNPVFQSTFSGISTLSVDVLNNTIKIPNHFFVTGEKVSYNYLDSDFSSVNAVGIATTTIVGFGITNKLPSTLYIVKVDDSSVKVSASASEALLPVPITLDLNSVGVGSVHQFTSQKQNSKCLISIDNVLQSPIVSTSSTTGITTIVSSETTYVDVVNKNLFNGGDLIKIDDEIMSILAVGVGTIQNRLYVSRSLLGTISGIHTIGSYVSKVTGNYNIVENTIHFINAPFGQIPIYEGDEENVFNSRFNGRVFLRGGVESTTQDTYDKNYVFDDISPSFTGLTTQFTLKSDLSNISGFSTSNAIILVNNIFQSPKKTTGIEQENQYSLSEVAGITSISFEGSTSSSYLYDINVTDLPKGGIVQSVGSTISGFGYQPLISAGGTVVVSSAGTIQSISIGNTGSGYRKKSKYQIITNTLSPIGIGSTNIFIDNKNSVFGIINTLNTGSNCSIRVGTYITTSTIVSTSSTFVSIAVGSTISSLIPSGEPVTIDIENPKIGIVNVSVGNSSVGISSITHVGFVTISGGYVSTTVSITNPGVGYTSSNQPYVKIDAPLPYNNIPLIYDTSSSGIGTGALINIVVGQGSSVINYEVTNLGFGYKQGDILTIGVGQTVGIPTNTSPSSFSNFILIVDTTYNDSFSGWHLGELQLIDSINSLVNGSKKVFPIKINGQQTSIISKKGSSIDIAQVLIIFVNDVLQVPNESYIFNGGSIIEFVEAPKQDDDIKILFYKGTPNIDVKYVDILETVKVGDIIDIQAGSNVLSEDSRLVEELISSDSAFTNAYFGKGVSGDPTLLRSLNLCRQTEDRFVNGEYVSKDRILYEPSIFPITNIISNVSTSSTTIFVESVKTFFDSAKEYDQDGTDNIPQKSIKILSQDSLVAASATAIVSSAGTITSLVISDGGNGYSTAPTVVIQNPVGSGKTTATAFSTISVGGTVSSITITNAGTGYTSANPPLVIIESPLLTYENITNVSYSGDFGIIVGVATTSIVGVASTGIVFDLFVPTSSFLRNASISVGIATTGVSGIKTDYLFVVSNSNIGKGVTSLNSSNQIVGVGSTFLDNIYSVVKVSIAQTSVPGIGITNVSRVVVSVDSYNGLTGTGYSSYFGDYSWGLINNLTRKEPKSFSYYNNGLVGISTSPIVIRTNPLKYIGYSTT